MALKKLLVANRGEIAVRIMRTAAEMEIETIAIFSEDDHRCLHVRRADDAVPLRGQGPTPYLDIDRLVQIAVEQGCDAVHPGYGFLSENSRFASRCENAGLTFVGPTEDTLQQLGNKVSAIALARHCKVPVLPGTPGPTDLAAAREIFDSLGEGAAVMVKAVAGGGGIGIRPVEKRGDLEAAFKRCRSEAEKAFGNGDLYVEKLLRRPRHVEVQIAGDGSGNVVDLGERDCSVQRRHQKILEIAPAPGLDTEVRRELVDAARKMAESLAYRGVGTFEFLVETTGARELFFIEANARLQVEHTVTEEVLGIDLVRLQLEIAAGRSLDELRLPKGAPGFAIQLRINAEQIDPNGNVRPQSGTLRAFDIPSGRGVRTDTAGYVGYSPNTRFDSLLAKIIVRSDSDSFDAAATKALRALRELRVNGLETNQSLLARLLQSREFRAGRLHTELVGEVITGAAGADQLSAPLFFDAEPQSSAQAGARIDSGDPLAVLEHGKATPRSAGPDVAEADDGRSVLAPVQGTVVSIEIAVGDQVEIGQELVVLEAMKMEHVVQADRAGEVIALHVAPGDTVFEGHRLLAIEAGNEQRARDTENRDIDLDAIRPDLAEALQRHEVGLDTARPEAVARRRKTGHRSARENVADLCDEGSFVEYGALVLAAQRRRRSTDELIERTPADGMVAGIGHINGDLFDEADTQCAVLSYDYTVLAGTQGLQNHRKKDSHVRARGAACPVGRALRRGRRRAPGGHRRLRRHRSRLSRLPALRRAQRTGAAGRDHHRPTCFAGQRRPARCRGRRHRHRGIEHRHGRPAMVEGGGLDVFAPRRSVRLRGPGRQRRGRRRRSPTKPRRSRSPRATCRTSKATSTPGNARINHVARRYSPENRLVIRRCSRRHRQSRRQRAGLEPRPAPRPGMVTAVLAVGIEGRRSGFRRRDPVHLRRRDRQRRRRQGGTLHAALRRLRSPARLPVRHPGHHGRAGGREDRAGTHAARMFVTGASTSVPFCTIVLRKGYGLGAQAMAGGSFKAPHFTVAWPTGEFGGMGLEGAVKLGFRRELAAVEDRDERNKRFKEMVDRMYQVGKAVNIASHFEIDDVIDPAETRRWILSAIPKTRRSKRATKKRPLIDTW